MAEIIDGVLIFKATGRRFPLRKVCRECGIEKSNITDFTPKHHTVCKKCRVIKLSAYLARR